jgi:hypothetical protein
MSKKEFELEGESIEEMRIKLQGTIGTFEIPNQSIRVKFFSTMASNRNRGSMEFNLLAQLKPMRERTESTEIEDLDVLFQRDLNDSRIAKGLVPYLAGLNSPVAFFPAILGVLIPKGFLTAARKDDYPKGSNDEEQSLTTYGEFWDFKGYKMKDKLTPFGVLSINHSKASVLVLDGQHRSNAFRYVTNTFLRDDDGKIKNDVYSAFYHGVEPPDNFASDLPVTIIWFEDRNGKKIDPALISRKLFVDVNNTSRKVNTSRNILLDDFEVPSLLTRFFLSEVLKKRKFELTNFSLVHSGFDVDSDASKGINNPLVVTSPQKIRDVMNWYFLGKRDYSQPNTWKAQKGYQNNIAIFERYFKTKLVRPGNEWKLNIADISQRDSFRKEFEKGPFEIFLKIYSEFPLFKLHYEICKSLNDYLIIKGKGNSTQIETWKKIFCGGEGLYYIFKEEEKNQIKGHQNIQLSIYLKAISEIESKFLETKFEVTKLDRSLFKEFNSDVEDGLGSIAFQVGLLMAYDTFRKLKNEMNENVDDYISVLGKYTIKNWYYFFGSLKKILFPNVDPSSWPSYHNLLMRMIQDRDRTVKYFKKPGYNDLPEVLIFKKAVQSLFDSWVFSECDGDYDVDKKKLNAKMKNWINKAKEQMEKILSDCGMSPFPDLDYEKYSTEIVDNTIKKNLDIGEDE